MFMDWKDNLVSQTMDVYFYAINDNDITHVQKKLISILVKVFPIRQAWKIQHISATCFSFLVVFYEKKIKGHVFSKYIFNIPVWYNPGIKIGYPLKEENQILNFMQFICI